MLCCVSAACDAAQGFACLTCKKLEDLAAIAARAAAKATLNPSTAKANGTSASASSPPKPGGPQPGGLTPGALPQIMPMAVPRPGGRHLRQATSSCPVGTYAADSGVLDPESKPAPGPGPGPAAPKGCTPCPEGES